MRGLPFVKKPESSADATIPEPMSTLSQRLAAIAVLVLAALVVAYVALRAFGVPIGVASVSSPPPEASASPASTASEAAPSGTAGPTATTGAGDLAAAVAEIEAQVRETRQLADPQIGAPEILTRDELVAELDASFAADYPPAAREADNITLRALGLLEPDQDVGELQQQLLTDQVLGFYDDDGKRMVIVSDAGLDALARITYAHEYTHALQDGAFGLAALDLDARGEDDRSLARLALIEGDATVSMFFWALQFAPEIMGEITETPVPDTEGVPQWMVEMLQFPYSAGATFVAQLWSTADPAAVDAVYADPPASTEQIIHPDKYVAGEAPIDIPVLDLAAAMGEGWTAVESTPMGEAQISIILAYLGAAQDEATAAASGWGGDRLTVARSGDDVALVWRFEWDRPADAAEFAGAYGDITGAIPLSTAVEQTSETGVLVVHGSSPAIVDAARDVAG